MLNSKINIIFNLLILIATSEIYAQESDSLSNINLKYDSILRTSENEMQLLFYKHNNDVLINNLGPYGSPHYYASSLVVPSKKKLKEEDIFINNLYELRGFKPYTNITYINASRKEQLFSLTHVQSLGTQLSLDFRFKKISSPGAFLNQEANNSLFNSNLNYVSKKKNYDAKFEVSIIKNDYQENGGLFSVADYEAELSDDEQNYVVNLNTSNSFEKKYEFGLKQRLDLYTFNDDSSNYSKIFFKHQITSTSNQKVFYDNDPLSSIYEHIFLDSIASIDSIYHNNFSNTAIVGFENADYNIGFFGQYDVRKYEQRFGLEMDYHDAYAGFLFGYQNGTLNIKGIAKVAIDGYREGDVESEVSFSFSQYRYSLSGSVGYYLNEADLKLVDYTSNHFMWSNSSFSKQSLAGANLSLKLKEIDLDFEMDGKLLNNTFYFDSLAVANQNNNVSSVATFRVGKNYKFFNFHFRSALIYQLTSDKFLFPLPQIIGRQIAYYQKHIFKKSLKVQLGVGISYATAHYGYAYMPAINEFYVQSTRYLGEYPKVDIFFNTQLKRAQIFLKYEHINSGSNFPSVYVT